MLEATARPGDVCESKKPSYTIEGRHPGGARFAPISDESLPWLLPSAARGRRMGSNRLPRAMPASSRDMVSFASPLTEDKATGGPAASTPGLPPPALSSRPPSLPFGPREGFKVEPGGWP